MNITPHSQALDKAKIGLMNRKDAVFYASVCLSLKHVWDDSLPTAATDGTCIYYNPEFLMSLSPDERVFLLFHEVSHVALDHITRGKAFNPKKYNYAADYVINLQAQQQGYKIPKGALLDSQYADMTTEAVYKLLPDPPANYDCDIKPSDADPEKYKQRLDDILIKAGMEARAAGVSPANLPAEIQFYIDSLVSPKLPWHTILRKVAMTLVKRDLNYRRPSRRYYPDFIIPTARSESMDSAAIICDTSGSVTDTQFGHFLSETVSVLKMIKPREISFVQFDTCIKGVDTVREAGDIKDIKFVGRGGTLIQPVLDWINLNKPKVAIIFTDGEFHPIEYLGKTPIIWIIHSNPNFQSKFGRIVHYNFKE